jgi:hypothetical protein
MEKRELNPWFKKGDENQKVKELAKVKLTATKTIKKTLDELLARDLSDVDTTELLKEANKIGLKILESDSQRGGMININIEGIPRPIEVVNDNGKCDVGSGC